MSTLSYVTGRFNLAIDYGATAAPYASPGEKRALDAMDALHHALTLSSLVVIMRQDGGRDFVVTLRDGRVWDQQLHVDGRVDFSKIRGSWTEQEATQVGSVVKAIQGLAKDHALVSLAAAWPDPDVREEPEDEAFEPAGVLP